MQMPRLLSIMWRAAHWSAMCSRAYRCVSGCCHFRGHCDCYSPRDPTCSHACSTWSPVRCQRLEPQRRCPESYFQYKRPFPEDGAGIPRPSNNGQPARRRGVGPNYAPELAETLYFSAIFRRFPLSRQQRPCPPFDGAADARVVVRLSGEQARPRRRLAE